MQSIRTQHKKRSNWAVFIASLAILGAIWALGSFSHTEWATGQIHASGEVLAWSRDEILTIIHDKSVDWGANQKFEDLIKKVAFAESGFNSSAKNKLSTASGLFQFLDSTWLSFCVNKYNIADGLEDKLDPYKQTDCAIIMIKNGGVDHWSASKHLWAK